MKRSRVLSVVAATSITLVLAATPSFAAGWLSGWSSASSTSWELPCGLATRAQGGSWASMTTGGCKYRTQVRAKYHGGSGNIYTTAWSYGDSTTGNSYVSVPNVTQHQVGY